MIKILFLLFFFSPLLLNALSLDDQMFQEGKELYEQTCISCHGKDGQTNKDMQLIVKPRSLQKTILTQEQSFQIIKEGAHFWGAHSHFMPPFKSLFDDGKISSLAFYISKSFQPKRDEKVAKLFKSTQKSTLSQTQLLENGEKIFTHSCSHCHGKKGDGKSLYVERSRANKLFIYPYNLTRTLFNEDQVFLYTKYGGHFWGTEGTHMPSWKRKYNDEELQSVANYVHLKIKQIRK